MALRAVDKNNPVPLYYQAETILEGAIRDGVYPPGSLFENEFDLAKALGISRVTLRRALDTLANKGLLVRERGVGTRVVAPPKVTRNLVSQLTGLHEDLAREGMSPVTQVLRLETVPCPDESAPHFDVEPGDPMLLLERLRFVDDRPIALMWNLFEPDTIEANKEELAERSLYQVMREQGVEPRVANQSITASMPTDEEATLLELDPASPILVLERISYGGDGSCIEHSRTRYAADRYAFEMRLVTS